MAPDIESQRSERQHDLTRVIALTDAVFAIIMTLLVLEVHVPNLGQGQTLGAALRDIRPTLVAFVIGFVGAAMLWIGHRDLFALIRRTNRGLVWLNILYMLPLCLLPFGAALLGRYNHDPAALHLFGMVVIGPPSRRR